MIQTVRFPADPFRGKGRDHSCLSGQSYLLQARSSAAKLNYWSNNSREGVLPMGLVHAKYFFYASIDKE